MLIHYGSFDTKEEAEKVAKEKGGSVTFLMGQYMVTSYPNEERKEAMRKAGLDPDNMVF